MKFTLDKHSLETFNKNHILEVDGFFSAQKMLELNRAIDELIAKEKLEKREDIMKFGHDLFLKVDNYKRLLQLPLMAEIVYELISVKPLRLAYDQLLVAAANSFDLGRPTTFLTHAETLENRSSVNELVLGVMIALNAKPEEIIPQEEAPVPEEGSDIETVALTTEEPVTEKKTSPFASETGRVVFFDPQISIPFDSLKTKLADRYLLLAFSTVHAQYLYNDLDPQNHFLKKLGYVYGDKLKDSINPVLLR